MAFAVRRASVVMSLAVRRASHVVMASAVPRVPIVAVAFAVRRASVAATVFAVLQASVAAMVFAVLFVMALSVRRARVVTAFAVLRGRPASKAVAQPTRVG